MALTPEEITGRHFTVVAHGYDCGEVDRFLAEVADSYRFAVHNLLPGVAGTRGTSVGSVPTDPSTATGPDDDPDRFGRLGDEVAAILRASSQTAEALVDQARAEADELLAAARADAEAARAEVATERSQARHLLVRAKEQADAVVAEADEHARRLVEQARAEAERRAEQHLARSRRHAEQILRAERAAVERLRTARAEIDEAITRLAGSETDPVLDLTSGSAVVRVGEIADSPDGPDQRRPQGIDPDRDPVRVLVRAAVDRAVEHSGSVDDAD